MNRRELLKLIAAATGGAMIGGEFFLSGCKNPEGGSLEFSEENIAFLDEVAETILPHTSTAGAKAAGVGRYMTVMVNDCYKKEDQEIFHKGMGQLNDACKKMHDHGFMKATPDQRKELLVSLDNERKKYNETKEKGSPNHYFQMMKQLTISGYFSSEKGKTEGLQYVPVPGRWDAVIDYKKGDKSFAGLG
jgi:glucoside 3-dehydrogenase (cytochrome c) hitch-hiker subunit